MGAVVHGPGIAGSKWKERSLLPVEETDFSPFKDSRHLQNKFRGGDIIIPVSSVSPLYNQTVGPKNQVFAAASTFPATVYSLAYCHHHGRVLICGFVLHSCLMRHGGGGPCVVTSNKC